MAMARSRSRQHAASSEGGALRRLEPPCMAAPLNAARRLEPPGPRRLDDLRVTAEAAQAWEPCPAPISWRFVDVIDVGATLRPSLVRG
jgi:hypothetical protein